MDEAEKRVVRWRKPAISERLQLTEALLLDLKDNGLISADIVKQMERDQNPQSKVLKLLDVVMACPEPSSFATLLFVLSKDNGWAVKDLEMDLKMEKGELEIEEEIHTEARMLVHRKFGTSKRLCEADKKDMGDLIAAKLQLQKEEWDREKEEMEGDIKRLKVEIQAKDTRSHAIAKQLRVFLHVNDRQLTTHAHGMMSTTQTLKHSLEDVSTNMLSNIERSLKSMLERLNMIIKHREHLMNERDNTLKVMALKDEKAALDQLVLEALDKAKAPKAEAMLIATKDSTGQALLIKRLNNRITQLEHELEDSDNTEPNGTGILGTRSNNMTGTNVKTGSGGGGVTAGGGGGGGSPKRQMSVQRPAPLMAPNGNTAAPSPRAGKMERKPSLPTSLQPNSVAQKRVVKKKVVKSAK